MKGNHRVVPVERGMNVTGSCVSSSGDAVALVVSKFNSIVSGQLLDGALDTLRRVGEVKEKMITTVWVPGVLEIPLAAKLLARTKEYGALIALGVIIKGDTQHHNLIADTCFTHLSKISVDELVPIAVGIVVAGDITQAIERAGGKLGNRGSEAALSALELMSVAGRLRSTPIEN